MEENKVAVKEALVGIAARQGTEHSSAGTLRVEKEGSRDKWVPRARKVRELEKP